MNLARSRDERSRLHNVRVVVAETYLSVCYLPLEIRVCSSLETDEKGNM